MTASRIGLVLGSGSARGWAHIGVIRALADAGIEPDIVCGSSIGALVGAAYASGNLDVLERWVRPLTFWDVVRLLDIKMQGGLIEGVTLMDSFRDKIRDTNIEQLDLPFAAVATDLGSGHEVWLQQGPLLPAVRASIALPGLFSPTRIDAQWLVDGGLVNPVPISLCRAMGADFIIAVNLNSDIVGRHLAPKGKRKKETPAAEEGGRRDLFDQLLKQLNSGLRERAMNAWRRERKDAEAPPGLFEVLASSINIMQDRITKSRMAGDPPDILLSPQLGQLGLLEFDRANEAIDEGVACVKRQLPQLRQALERLRK
ncbi:patatin-like phospholipase RssA [Sulfurivermis fontis]|uniref:patatin-like phospholipase RssA n=1 Tax=Sulfurivermis fontis TaxID=1972068 RepID=UPI000FD89118|nr:patatin-like phospholipase RssA [Sulfurivermis fontis]